MAMATVSCRLSSRICDRLILCGSSPFDCSASGRKKKKNYEKFYPKIKPTKLPYPKYRPAPLLPDPKLRPQTKIQALESVICDLEASLKNGVTIDDPQVFASLLETCFRLSAFDHGFRVHALIPAKLLRRNTGILSKLLRLYASRGDLEHAHKLFDEMPDRNSSAFPWNSLISGYAEAGFHEDALALFFQMVEEGVIPDEHTFPRVLKACGGVGMIHVGEEVHRHVIRFGFGGSGFVLNGLIDMYAKCGDISRAMKVFNIVKNRDVITWNAMIVGLVRHGSLSEALDRLKQMVLLGYEPDSVTLSSLLRSLRLYRTGTQIHGWALRKGIEYDLPVANSLMVFYSINNQPSKARSLFAIMPEKDAISWNTIISAHSKDPLALEYFEGMIRSGERPDEITFVSLLSACACLGMLSDGERLFSAMCDEYMIEPSTEHCGCMVSLYARAGCIETAYDFITKRMEAEAGPAVWGALLYGCYLHGNADVGRIAAEHLMESESESDNAHNFELLIRIYEDAGMAGDAEEVREMMRMRGL
ncbi:hypothetical protein M569_06226 [Genlisea aurea]|uniref:Pentatricopeptide repeat-containing protein n=1 Tax=Genlisea aurea TaxID=192259 RepID=S8CUH7_9LAMI|nr:hypothetical protein M569_06226 [Genlisea aurea]